MYPSRVPLRRRLAYIAASLIAAAGMIVGDSLGEAARRADGESWAAALIGIGSWTVAGVVGVLIDRTVPARAIGLASTALPLLWFGGLIVSEEKSLWWAGIVLIAVFGLIASLSAAATKLVFRLLAPK